MLGRVMISEPGSPATLLLSDATLVVLQVLGELSFVRWDLVEMDSAKAGDRLTVMNLTRNQRLYVEVVDLKSEAVELFRDPRVL